MQFSIESLEGRVLFDSAPALPDLVGVSIVAAPGNYFPGDALRVLGSVKNIGTGDFPDIPRTIRVYLSTGPSFGQGDDVLVGRFDLGDIAPGGTARFDDFLSVPDDISPGAYYVTGVIDPLHQVAQSDTSNDTFASPAAAVLVAAGTAPGPGDVNLDPRFGSGGALNVALNGQPFATTSTIVDNHGRFLIVGSILDNPNESGFFKSAIVRVSADGTLDTSFGSGGVVFTDYLNGNLGHPIAVTPDDKIVLTAEEDDSISINDPLRLDLAVARFNDDGSVDGSFGTGGKIVTDLTPIFRPGLVASETRNLPNSLVLGADGSIYVALTVELGAGRGNDMALAKFTAEGQLDTTFNGSGAADVDIAGNDEDGIALALQRDGKIVVVGDTSQANGDSTILAARFNADGSLDTKFADAGRFFAGPTGALTGAHGVAIQKDGKILIAGSANEGSLEAGDAHSPLYTLRLTKKGRRDRHFGVNGAVMTDVPGFTNATANDVFVDARGRVLVSGLVARTVADFLNDRTGLVIVRYDHRGRLDGTFADGGIATLFVPPVPEEAGAGPGAPPSVSAADLPGDFANFTRQGTAVVAVTPGGGVFAIATAVSPDQTETVITIESVAADSPDLVAGIARKKAGVAVAAGGKTVAQVKVTNSGSGRARGAVGVAIYLSATPAVAEGAAPLLTTTLNVDLKSGKGKSRTYRLVVPGDVVAGGEYLVVVITPAVGIADPDPRNDVAAVGITVG